MLIIILLLWNSLYFVAFNYIILDRIQKNFDTPFYVYLLPVLFLINIYYVFKTGHFDRHLQIKEKKSEENIKNEEVENRLKEINKQNSNPQEKG